MHNFYPWQTKQWQQLLLRFHNNAFPHALLLNGNNGLGQFDFALALAELLLCQNALDVACGNCSACVLLKANTHPDLIKVQIEEGKNIIRIDQIREAIEKSFQTPQQGKRQVIVIDHAQSMNTAAANALLKSLEEPSGNVVFILLSYSLYTLPATIRSRCQMVNFTVGEKSIIRNWLATRINNSTELDVVLHAADYIPFDALNIYEKNILEQNNKLIKSISDLRSNSQSLLALANSYSKENLLDTLNSLLRLSQDLIKFKLLDNNSLLKVIFPINMLSQLAKNIELLQIITIQEKILQLLGYIQKQINLNPQLLLEDLFIMWCAK